jgi:hypothetical protein
MSLSSYIGVQVTNLCAIPDIAGGFRVLLNNGENTSSDNMVGTAEVMIDF